MTTNISQLKTAVSTAATALAAAEQELARVAAAKAAFDPQPHPDPVSDMLGLEVQFQDVAAAVRLGEATSEQLDAARLALEEARARQVSVEEGLRADAVVMAGIERRLAAAAAARDAAEAALATAKVTWIRAEALAEDASYTEHARAAAAAAHRLESLKAWLISHGGGHLRGGGDPWRRELVLPPLGPSSHAAMLEARPHVANGYALPSELLIFPHVDPAAARLLVNMEVDALSQSEPPKEGLFARGVARVKRALGADTAPSKPAVDTAAAGLFEA